MKIFIIVEQFDPDKGYLEYYLVRELSNLGHHVWIVTFNDAKAVTITKPEKEDFQIVNVPFSAVIHGYHVPKPNALKPIKNLIEKNKPDIVHCQPFDSPLALLFISLKNLYNYKIVGTLISGVLSAWTTKLHFLLSISKLTFRTFIRKRFDVIFAKNKELALLMERSYGLPSNSCRLIPLGADPELFKFDLEARTKIRNMFKFTEKDVVLVYSGKIYPSKGLEILVDALVPIVKTNKNVKLLIVGKGEPSYIEYLKKHIFDNCLSESVFFQNWVHRGELYKFYSASDIAVWPGYSSVSIVEAASTGLPLVVARYLVELYALQNKNGFLFEPGDIDSLCKHLEKLIHDKRLRRDMGKRSRLLVERKLNWKSITLEYLNAYQVAHEKETSHPVKNY
jgi:glycosyltransferase involved in cell wall biosynthesis